MFKSFIKKIISSLIQLWSHVYSYRFSVWLKEKHDMFYTMWISNFIGEVGEHCIFHHPLQLLGMGEKRIHIGAGTVIGSYGVLGSWEHYGKDGHYEPEIIIGNGCNIGEYCHITAIDKITIGDGLLTGRFVYLGDNAHGRLSLDEADTPPAQRRLTTKGEIKIGKNVWIGDKVSVLSGVSIGDNVIVGAGSIVTHNIPSNSLAIGAPAKVIKQI